EEELYDKFVLPFIKDLAQKGTIDAYYGQATSWRTYAGLKNALKGEVGVDFRDPTGILRKYLRAAAEPFSVYLKSKLEEVKEQETTEIDESALEIMNMQFLKRSDIRFVE